MHLTDEITKAWEGESELVCIIVDAEGILAGSCTIERVVKHNGRDTYDLIRYFTIQGSERIHVSVDLSCVSANAIIKHLADRL